MKRSIPIVLLMLLMLPVGCKKFGGGSEKISWPDNPQAIIGDYKTKVKGARTTISYYMPSSGSDVAMMLQVHFFEVPAGAMLSIGKLKKRLSGESRSWSPKVDIGTALGLLEIRLARSTKIDLGLTATIAPKNGKKLTFKLPSKRVAGAISHALKKARDGGMSFGKEPPVKGKPRSIAVLSYSDFKVIGSARLVRDIDWVLFHEKISKPRKTVTCKFKKYGNLPVDIFDSTGYLIDRRTGKQIAVTTLKADETCPMFAMIRNGRASNTVGETEVTRWARTQLPR